MKKFMAVVLTLVMILALVPTAALAADVDITDSHTHAWGSGVVTVPATCKDTGERVYTCPCGETRTEIIPVSEYHTWGDWEIEIEATCSAAGLKTRACQIEGCAASQSKEIEALDHDFSSAWKYDANQHWLACVNSGCSEATVRTNHVWNDGVETVAAQPGVAGEKTFTCRTCHATRTESIPALPVIVPTYPVAPTEPEKVEEPAEEVEEPAEEIEEPAEEIEDEKAPLTEKPMLFTDVAEKAWYYDAVKYVFQNDLMSGTNAAGTKFAPEMTTTRGMLVAVLYRMGAADVPMAEEPASFTDVSDKAYYADAVAWASAVGVVEGYNGGFGGDDVLTREQLVVMIYRYAKVMGYDVSASADLADFADADALAGWAKDAMRWAVGVKLIEGGSGKLQPKGDASRAQLATIMMRMADIFGDQFDD